MHVYLLFRRDQRLKGKENNAFLMSIFFVFRLLVDFNGYLLFPVTFGGGDNYFVLLGTDLCSVFESFVALYLAILC